MNELLRFLTETTYLEMSLARLLLAFGLILAGFIVRKVLSSFVLHRLAQLTRRTDTELDDLLVSAAQRPLEIGVILAGIGFACGVLGLPVEPVNVRRLATAILTVAITLDVVWMLFRLIDGFSTFFEGISKETESKIDDALIPLFRKALKVFLGLLAFVVVIQNLGYSVTGIVAGLGVGGLALALAAQDTVANLFGSIMILLDRPFKVGDWVRGANFEGVVEEVGFRSTRVRTFPKTLVTVPNKEMANLIIDNQQAMPIRRMDIAVGVTYSTSAKQMRDLLAGLKQILSDHPDVRDDGILVRFTEFGGSSLNLLVRGFTDAVGFVEHTRIREDVLLKIMDLVESLDLEFAFPSQSLYFGKGEVLTVRNAETTER